MRKSQRRPTTIMVIRHAEKPTRSHSGVTLEGKREKECLRIRGWQRAGALASFFAPAKSCFAHQALAKPRHLFASKPIRRSGSRRAIETITPLSEKLGIRINFEFQRDNIEEMVDEAFSCGGVVLICWQYEYIPKIANYILGSNKVAPQHWPADRFDLVWVFERDARSDHYSFHQVPQCLLIGDSPTPIRRHPSTQKRRK